MSVLKMSEQKLLNLVLCKIARNSLMVFGLTTYVPDTYKNRGFKTQNLNPFLNLFRNMISENTLR